MMKLLFILMSTVLLSGCIYQSVDYKVIKAAEVLCKEHGGVNYINSDFTGAYSSRCANGQYVNNTMFIQQLNIIEQEIIIITGGKE
jgi:hypothetical protein